MGGLSGPRNRKALWAQTYPEGFHSPEKLEQDFSYRYPSSSLQNITTRRAWLKINYYRGKIIPQRREVKKNFDAEAYLERANLAF
jgi:hypothetical protein